MQLLVIRKLIHVILDTLAPIPQTTYSNALFCELKYFVWIQISLNFAFKGSINNKSILV